MEVGVLDCSVGHGSIKVPAQRSAMAALLLLPYCKDLNQSTPPVMLPLCSPLWALWEGTEEGSSITHQKPPLVLPLLSQKHIQSCLLLGTPLLSLKKVLPVDKMLCAVNE